MGYGKWIETDSTFFQQTYPHLYMAAEREIGTFSDGQKIQMGISANKNLKIKVNCETQIVRRENIWGDAKDEFDAFQIYFHEHCPGSGFLIKLGERTEEHYFNLDNIRREVQEKYVELTGNDAMIFKINTNVSKKKIIFRISSNGMNDNIDMSVGKNEISLGNTDEKRVENEKLLVYRIVRVIMKEKRKEDEQLKSKALCQAKKSLSSNIYLELKKIKTTGQGDISWTNEKITKDESGRCFSAKITHDGRCYRYKVFLRIGNQPADNQAQYQINLSNKDFQIIRTQIPGKLCDEFQYQIKSEVADRIGEELEAAKRAIFTTELEAKPGQPSHCEESNLKKCADNYNSWHKDWLDGSNAELDENVKESLCLKNNTVILQNGAKTIIWQNGTKTETFSARYKEFLELKTDKKRERAKEKALAELGNLVIMQTKKENIPGILNGDTLVDVKYEHGTFPYLYKTPAYTDTKGWLTALKANKKEILAEIKHREDQYEKERINKYKPYADSWLVRDIFKVVEANEKYITSNAVSQILRGTQVQLNASINPSGGQGKYNAIPVADIKATIDRMVEAKILRTKTCKGTYGNFDILKINHDAVIGFHTWEEPGKLTDKQLRALYKALRAGKDLSDYEVSCIIKDIIGKDEHTNDDYMDMILAANFPAAVLWNMEAINGMFQYAPKEVVAYVQMVKEGETGVKKRILQLYLKKSHKIQH